MRGRQVPAEHLAFPAAIHADDGIRRDRSANRNRRGSLDKGFCCWVTEFPKGLMDGRDQRRELIGWNRITPQYAATIFVASSRPIEVAGSSGILVLRFEPARYHTGQIVVVIEDSPYDFVAPATSFRVRPSRTTQPPFPAKKLTGRYWSLLSTKYFSDHRKGGAGSAFRRGYALLIGIRCPPGYRFCPKPKYASAAATSTPSQLTQNGMLKPPISTCHPRMIRRRWTIATTRNSEAVIVR
jgi:hypothetical protein